jgi:peptidoglycan/LPS O-acetylase OafA/YrhL
MQSADRSGYFAGLTALRGIAALCIVLFHAPGIGLGSYFISLTGFVLRSYLWVDFFFVLSGFVLMHAYGAFFRQDIRTGGFLRYMRARFARIYPLHAAMLLFLLAVEIARRYAFDHHPVEFSNLSLDVRLAPYAFLPSVLLIHSLGILPFDSWNDPSWSISCEAAVYFLFPALCLSLTRAPRRVGPLLVGGGIVLLAMIYFVARPHDLDVTSTFGFFRCFAEFSFGMCCYAYYASRGVPRWLAGDGAAAVIVAALVLELHLDLSDLVAVPLFCALVLTAAGNGGRFNRLLLTRPLQWLGNVSYSIYLVHWPLMVAIAMAIYAATGIDPTTGGFGIVPRLGFLGIAVAATLLAASFTYRTIEVPLRQMITGRRAARPTGRAELRATGEAAF